MEKIKSIIRIGTAGDLPFFMTEPLLEQDLILKKGFEERSILILSV